MIERLPHHTAAPAETLVRFGQVALAVLSVAAALTTLGLVASGSTVVALLVPFAAIAAVFAFTVVTRPLLHLCVVLGLSVTIISYEEGIQWYEAIYGLYFFAYLGGWAFVIGALRRDVLIKDAMDVGLLLLLAYSTLTFAMTVLHGGDLSLGFREWVSLALFGFIFPVRRAIECDHRALRWLAWTFLIIALVILARNVVWYLEGLQRAEYLWQIATGRVRMNENFLMVAAICSVSLAAYSQRAVASAGLVAAAGLFVAGVVIGQSRAVWVSMFLGFAVVFFAVGRQQKTRLLLFGSISLAVVISLGAILLEDFFEVVVVGLLDRITTLGTDVTTDVSLVNRFIEWQHVMPLVLENPLYGHGFGSKFAFYDIIYHVTDVKSHVHNTYLSYLYHHGLIGLGLLFYFFATVISRTVRLLGSSSLDPFERAILIGAVSSLAALALAAMTESLLTVNDGVLVIMFSLSACIGLVGRYGRGVHEPRR